MIERRRDRAIDMAELRLEVAGMDGDEAVAHARGSRQAKHVTVSDGLYEAYLLLCILPRGKVESIVHFLDLHLSGCLTD
jgi:hypothetical protein